MFPEDRGLFVQDAGDGDDATSDGIFVAEILDPEMIEHFPIGTRVRVTGVVREKFDQTILDTNGSAAAVVARGPDAVPAPVTLDPVPRRRRPTAPGGRAYYERFEGMRVRIAEGTANSGGTNKFGELFLTLGPEQDRVFRTDTRAGPDRRRLRRRSGQPGDPATSTRTGRRRRSTPTCSTA